MRFYDSQIQKQSHNEPWRITIKDPTVHATCSAGNF